MKSLITISLLLLVVCFKASAISTGQLVGKILVKETKLPLALTEIVFENSMDRIVVSANEYGIYYADHLPTGRYNMTVVYNNRNFTMKNVRVYDSYTMELNFVVSNDSLLPKDVEVFDTDTKLSSVESHDIKLANTGRQPTRTLSEALGSQPGVDIRNGKMYVKGSDQVKFFIDGSPTLAPATIMRE
ncbi:MAG: hypothetical protein U0V74_06915 [Chitinophagales bacterium]